MDENNLSLEEIIKAVSSEEDAPEFSDQEKALEFYKLMFPEHTVDSLLSAMTREQAILGSKEFSIQLRNTGSYIERLKRMLDAHSQQTEFVSEAIGKLINVGMVGDSYEHKADPENPDDEDYSLKNRTFKVDKSFNGAEVSGTQARMIILAANNNVKKTYLYNSGFNIVMRGPSLIEINLIYNRLNDQMNEYGRMLGAIFYIYSDLKIKEILWELIESLVIHSNLNKWDKGNRLKDNVSVLDYPAILLSIGSLMFKNGYPFVHVCTNPDCRYSTEENIDLNLLQLTDFSRIPDNRLKWLTSAKPVNSDQIREYQKELGIKPSVDINNYRLYLKVPSMSTYLTHGNEYNDELARSIHDIRDAKVIDQYLKYNYSRMFEPWISHVEALNEDGTVSFKVADQDNITLILNEIQNSEFREELSTKLNDYIQTANLTNVGFLATPCGSCNTMPSNTINGFVPFDAQSAFFSMLVMRLIQIN